MKKIVVIWLVALMFMGCGVNQQLKQIKALEKCEYQITSADSVYLANTDIAKLISGGNFNIESAPALAFALLTQNLPLKAQINLQIKNPGSAVAGINEFKYKVMLKDFELTEGSIDRKIVVEPKGGVTVVPIKINQNIYPLFADSKMRNMITDFLTSKTEKKTTITLKVKPSLDIGNEKIQYPGYISIDKEISNRKLTEHVLNKGF